MALLIVNLDKQIGTAQMWRDNFAEQLPDLEIRIFPEANDLDAAIELAARIPAARMGGAVEVRPLVEH